MDLEFLGVYLGHSQSIWRPVCSNEGSKMVQEARNTISPQNDTSCDQAQNKDVIMPKETMSYVKFLMYFLERYTLPETNMSSEK